MAMFHAYKESFKGINPGVEDGVYVDDLNLNDYNRDEKVGY